MTREQTATFFTYTGSRHDRINEGLRVTPPVIQPEVDVLTDVLDRARLGEAVTVYRGVTRGAARDIIAANLQPGDPYVNKGFVSTSRIRKVGEQFRANDPVRGVLLIVHLPPTARALDLSSISRYGRNLDILGPPPDEHGGRQLG